jgi:hypothetical protein
MKYFAVFALFALVACDDKKKDLVDSVVGDSAAPTMSFTASTDAAPPPPASFAMPERPVPKPETMVSQTAPDEVQMKAMTYMVAMRAPHPDDPNADEAYATDLMNKLRPISVSMDPGDNKQKWNSAEVEAGGRQVLLKMSAGCDAKMPFTALVSRANVPLATARSHGVLVIKCADQKKQCLQSTRDPDDVLCTTNIRHSK